MKWLNLKTALILSVVVNLFLVASMLGAGFVLMRHLMVMKPQMDKTLVWSQKVPEGEGPDMTVFELAKDAAKVGEADMKTAMGYRAEALALAGKEPFDKVAIVALTEKARQSELAARQKVETAMIEKLASEPKEVRQKVMTHMMRPGFRHSVVMRYQVRENHKIINMTKAGEPAAEKDIHIEMMTTSDDGEP